MPSINKVIIAGHLGRDPEIRYTGSGRAVANFSVATSERWKDKEGEWKTETEWHRIVAWNQLAEKCDKLRKGDSVFVEGKIKSRSWDDSGQRRTVVEILASQVNPLKGGDNSAKAAQPDKYKSHNPEPTEKPKAESKSDYYPPPPEDDIPF